MHLEGDDLRYVLHTYGTVGIVTRLRLPLVAAHAWQGWYATFDSFDACYGFGWEITKVGGRTWVSHSGEWAGTATYITRSLNDGLTVIVLSNLENFDSAGVGDQVMEIARKEATRAK